MLIKSTQPGIDYVGLHAGFTLSDRDGRNLSIGYADWHDQPGSRYASCSKWFVTYYTPGGASGIVGDPVHDRPIAIGMIENIEVDRITRARITLPDGTTHVCPNFHAGLVYAYSQYLLTKQTLDHAW